MARRFPNAVKTAITNTPSTTGVFTIGAAVTGYVDFDSAVADSELADGDDFVLYIEEDAVGWEIRGGCILTAGTPDSVSRGTLRTSSTGSAVDFTSAATVEIVLGEEDIIQFRDKIGNLVEDTTPQLGAALDANGKDIDMGANTITDGKVGNWDTAFGWGDHGSGGYYGSGGTDVAVTDGGTGRSTSTTAYALLAAGTTATGVHQTLAAGATTEILVGAGAAALPAWTTATGSGAPVRATSPTLVTPALGTPTALTLTNATGLPIIAGTTGTLTVARGGTGATTLTGLVKGNGTGAFTAAVAGTDYEAADADILKADTDDVLAAGFSSTTVDDGTPAAAATYTPSITGGNYRKIINTNAFTIAIPTVTSGDAVTISLIITNDASPGVVTIAAGYQAQSTVLPSATANEEFMCRIEAFNVGGTTYASFDCVALQ